MFPPHTIYAETHIATRQRELEADAHRHRMIDAARRHTVRQIDTPGAESAERLPRWSSRIRSRRH